MTNVFSIRFYEERKLHNMSQSELAKILDLDRTTIGKWENGKSFPSSDVLLRVSEIFGVSTDYLLGNTNIKKQANKSDPLEEFPEGVDVLRRSTKELSPEARKVMIRHMNNFINDLKEMEKEDNN